MRNFTKSASGRRVGLVTLVAAAALAGCSPETNPVRDAAVAVGAGAKLTPAPDFVARSRPATLDYIPVGTAAPARATPARTAEQVKAAETELDAVRAANAAAAQNAQEAGAQAAATPATAKPKPKAPRSP